MFDGVGVVAQVGGGGAVVDDGVAQGLFFGAEFFDLASQAVSDEEVVGVDEEDDDEEDHRGDDVFESPGFIHALEVHNMRGGCLVEGQGLILSFWPARMLSRLRPLRRLSWLTERP